MMESGEHKKPHTEWSHVTAPLLPPDTESFAQVVGSGEITAPAAIESGESDDPIEDLPAYQRAASSEQVHHIGGTLIRGAHPDPRVRRMITKLHHTSALRTEIDEMRFSMLSTVNHEHGPQLAEARQKLTNDFGEQTGNVPIKLLPSPVFDQVIGEQADAVARAGHVIARADSSDLAMYGPRVVVKSVLHEGAHLAGDTERETVTFVREPAGKRIFGLSSSAQYGVKELPAHGFYEPVPDGKGGMAVGGYFIEEGFVESYAGRGAVQMGLGVTATGTILFDSSDGAKVGFADDAQRLPHYNPADGRVYLPWDYGKGVYHLQESGEPYSELVPSALPAYAIDLLDQQLPGLFDTMKASRNDKDAIAYVKEQINSVEPGLYDTLACLPYDPVNFQRGLIKVERALGVVNRAVRSLPAV
jgi:hypothetical protein